MEKKKVVMKIESYSNKDGMLLLSVEDWSVRTAIKSLVELCEKKHGNYIKLEMSPPYKPRSTDVGGQNRHIWGHLQQIAQETGNDIDDVEDYIKQRALRRGYPTHQNKMNGVIKPVSMKGINTVEANYLIEELHQLASELGIELEEGE